jgi:hypothetical protein
LGEHRAHHLAPDALTLAAWRNRHRAQQRDFSSHLDPSTPNHARFVRSHEERF